MAARRRTARPAFIRVCERQSLLVRHEADDADSASAIVATPCSLASCSTACSIATSDRSLRFNVEQTVRVAGAVRDRLSSDNWRLLNRLTQLFAKWPAPGGHLDEALEVIDDALVSLVAVGGLEMAHMTRDQGWRFLSLGRHLERLQFIATTLEDSRRRRRRPRTRACSNGCSNSRTAC